MKVEEMNIFQKMATATEKINRVAKNLSVGVGQSAYKAVGEADVLNAIKPVEYELGIYSYPVIREVIYNNEFTTESTYNGQTKEKLTIFMRVKTVYRFVNTDKPTEFIEIETFGDGVDTQDKAPGKAMTYADKYALLKAYKIETGDDPDQNKSEDMKKKQPAQTASVNKELSAFEKIAKKYDVDLVRYAKYIKKPYNDLTQKDVDEAIAKKLANAEQKKEVIIE